MNLLQLFWQGDTLARGVALVLFAMSVGSWVVILWKGWLLRRAGADVTRCVAAFWQSASFNEAADTLQRLDRETLVMPLLQASQTPSSGTLAAAADRSQQLTRLFRQALQAALVRLQHGQTLLATVGATAPFVGLLGTVWGIYHALTSIAMAGQVTIDRIAGPVGEALIMTAAGLVVAIPAVLAYNVMGRAVTRIEADLEGFARDLLTLMGNDVAV